ncbi:putative tRNA pseudouridine synthase D (TruD) [Trypanosoma vivax]|nr:putative tRNA pseudouridine synthase D (TruD) [Trypanosoma vivax]
MKGVAWGVSLALLEGTSWVWKVEPTRLGAIDFLAYRLGLYDGTTPTRTAAHEHPERGGRRCRAERLNKLASRLSLQVAPESLVPQRNREPPRDRCGNEARSFSSLDEMQRRMREWEHERRSFLLRETEALGKEEEEAAALMRHPASLFDDEAAILSRFGMGCFVSSSGTGFDGLFRQHWKDFLVTEMVHDDKEVAVPLCRAPDWTIPPLPPSLMAETQQPDDNCTEAGAEVGGNTGNYASLFSVDVKQRLGELLNEEVRDAGEVPKGSETKKPCAKGTFFLQCHLHKQHVAHSIALANIAQTLRMHPSQISVAGIKDYIGDTLQRVRLQNITPASALAANRIFRKKKWSMSLSDFSYHTEPLVPGRLYGNHFKIVLRDVTAPREHIERAIYEFGLHGFPNYYGCQRFSWFGGREDAAFAILNQNWLVFAFRFLGYTVRELTLRDLLQRAKKYPNPLQDEYRRNVVRRLRSIAVEPSELDEPPFLSCPPLGTPLASVDGGPISRKQELILLQLKGAFMDLTMVSRRMTAQRLCSYLWNQVLTLRLHHFGGQQVLLGDMIVPEAFRQVETLPEERRDWYQGAIRFIEEESERAAVAITDVVHPGFSFNGIRRPGNPVGEYFLQVCGKYHLDWYARHSQAGINDFLEPPRPIVRKPMNLRYEYDIAACKLTLEFALERGCYANVALTELMRQARCVGADDILLLPAPEGMWDIGDRDPGYVTSMQDIYEGFQDGVGFVNDAYEPPLITDVKPWDYTAGPLFLPESADPVRKAYRWGERHLLRNMARRERDEEEMKRRLFEKPLALTLKDGEVNQYAGHTVPMPPNAKPKKIFFKVLRRQRRYPGAPKIVPRIRRGAQTRTKTAGRVPFKTISKDTWNVTW